jgi:peptidoglycan/LPS O-acetylase OafA/YrhL
MNRTVTPAHKGQPGHDVLISWLRGLAALQVAAAHLRAEVFPGMSHAVDPSLAYQGVAFVTGFAHQAVMLFFVLSGWLVGGSYLDRLHRPHALRDYMVDRLTRLWTVLIPALLLTLLLAWLAKGDLAALLAEPSYALRTMAGNLVGLQTLQLPTYGGNFPLWSLANETWYYALFPLLVLAWRTPSLWKLILVLALMTAIVNLTHGVLLSYFAIWLLGVAASRMRLTLKRGLRACLLLGAAGVAVYCRLGGNNDDLGYDTWGQDMAFSLLFALWLAAMRQPLANAAPVKPWLARAGNWLAGFSFSLYVIHIPLMEGLLPFWRTQHGAALLSPSQPLHLGIYAIMLAVLVLGAWMFYVATERHTVRIRRAMKARLDRIGLPAPQPPAALP